MENNMQFDHLIRHHFADFEPNIVSNSQPKAAVLVPFVLMPEPAILLTVRAKHLNSHPGEVSFPGGMYEAEDRNLFDTALRETFEEIALERHLVDVVGQLSTSISKNGVLVYPIVGLTQSSQTALASPDEIEEIFTVPWSFFATAEPQLQQINRHGLEIQLPHFYYEGKHIWGLTAIILLELINLLEGTDWPMPDYRASI